jgi:hypothetical protein
VEAQNKGLAKQLETLARLRESEPEKALQEQAAKYEAQVKGGHSSPLSVAILSISPWSAAQETLINDLNSRLARVEPMARSGKSAILEFFSREAVDAEKKSLVKENAALSASIRDRDTSISEKNKKIEELERYCKPTGVVARRIDLTLSF